MAEKVILVRHGETEWSKSGQHTSTTDLPLTEAGERAANSLQGRLASLGIDRVFTSPRQRAKATAALALPGMQSTVIEDLAEWTYGEYEGLTSDQIHERDPSWVLWVNGCPGGESPQQMWERTGRLIELSEKQTGTIAFFAHGHILRSLGLHWLDLDFAIGERFLLNTSSVSVLSHAKGQRALETWNS